MDWFLVGIYELLDRHFIFYKRDKLITLRDYISQIIQITFPNKWECI